MPALDRFAQEKTVGLESKSQKRQVKTTSREEGVQVVRAGVKLVSFSCNDYLGLSHHPKVIEAGTAALKKYGAGAGASRLVTGNHPLYDQLEARLATWKGTEAACVFGSGYLANIGIIQALVGKDDLIVADKLVHACLIDGAILSGAKLLRFAHNDIEHCRTLLASHRVKYQNCLILTDGVFSMDGDVAPLTQLSLLADGWDAWLMSDDAHGLGVLAHGKGSAALAGEDVVVPLQMGTLSKAIGSYGGYLCASKYVIDYIKSTARSLIYSTALPPSVVASALAALEIIIAEPELVALPLAKARLFTSLLNLPEAQSAVVPLVIGEPEAAMQASAVLERAGFLVSAIRPPTVPEHTSRLRFAFCALHDDKDIERLAELIRSQNWL